MFPQASVKVVCSKAHCGSRQEAAIIHGCVPQAQWAAHAAFVISRRIYKLQPSGESVVWGSWSQ